MQERDTRCSDRMRLDRRRGRHRHDLDAEIRGGLLQVVASAFLDDERAAFEAGPSTLIFFVYSWSIGIFRSRTNGFACCATSGDCS